MRDVHSPPSLTLPHKGGGDKKDPFPTRGGVSKRLPHGFTLIEILVVVVVLSITITMVTLSVGNRSSAQALEEEARRLFAVFEFAREHAIVQAKELGFYFESDRYQVLTQGLKGWQPVTEEKVLKTHSLPNQIKWYLSLEANDIVLKKNPKDKTLAPQILFLSSGEITPFELRLTLIGKDTHEFTVQCTDVGEIVLLKDGEKY